MQDYKYIQRALVGGASVINPDGSLVAQNFSEFMSYINEMYLSQGYEIHTVTLLRHVPPTTEAPNSFSEYGYHLVKTLPEAKSKGKAE